MHDFAIISVAIPALVDFSQVEPSHCYNMDNSGRGLEKVFPFMIWVEQAELPSLHFARTGEGSLTVAFDSHAGCGGFCSVKVPMAEAD